MVDPQVVPELVGHYEGRITKAPPLGYRTAGLPGAHAGQVGHAGAGQLPAGHGEHVQTGQEDRVVPRVRGRFFSSLI